jgi:hypothetical protein
MKLIIAETDQTDAVTMKLPSLKKKEKIITTEKQKPAQTYLIFNKFQEPFPLFAIFLLCY